MKEKITRKATGVTGVCGPEELRGEVKNGRKIIRSTIVDEEDNLYGRTLIDCSKGEERKEKDKCEESSGKDQLNTCSSNDKQKPFHGARLSLSDKGWRTGRRKIGKSSQTDETISAMENHPENMIGYSRANRRIRLLSQTQVGNRTSGYSKRGTASGSQRRSSVSQEYDRMSRSGLTGQINNRLAVLQRRVYLAGRKTIEDNKKNLTRTRPEGKQKSQPDSNQLESLQSDKINRKRSLRGKNGEPKRKGNRVVRGAERLLTGSYRKVPFGEESREGMATDEMASRMSVAVAIFIKFLALSLVVLELVAKLLLLIVTALVCVIVVIVVNVTLISVLIAIITAILVAILTMCFLNSEEEENISGEGASYVQYRTIEEAFSEVEAEYSEQLNAYLDLPGYAGYRVEGEKANFHDILELWLVLGDFEAEQDVWVSGENMSLLRELYWEFNELELSVEMQMVSETITYTDGTGATRQTEAMVGKRIAVITATAKHKEEVMAAHRITEKDIETIDVIIRARAEEIYQEKIKGKELEIG